MALDDGPPRYDFDALKADHAISEVVGERVKIKRVGREMVGLCPFHAERTPSFTCNDDRAFAHCFGCGWHGDVIDFIAKYHGLTTGEAFRYLGGDVDIKVSDRPRPAPKLPPEPSLRPMPVPDSHEPFQAGRRLTAWNPKLGAGGEMVSYTPDAVWAYEDEDCGLLGYILRIDRPGGDKIIIPLRPVVGKDGDLVWAAAHLAAPRPLYGLPRLVQSGQVFLFEGEKAADAGAALLPGASLAWPGGVNGVPYTDFSPLAGRRVVVWGDADEGGEAAAKKAGLMALAAGAVEVKLIAWDQDKAKGWDAADALEEGWTPVETLSWLKARAYLLEPGPDDVVEPATPEPPPAALAAKAEGDFDANPFTGELPPPRPWAFGRVLLHRTVTALAAPPGTGKSTWGLQLALAFCQHRKLGPFDPIRTGPAWVWNNEDDGDELNRRTLAACIEMGISPASLAGRLYLNSGGERALIVAKEVPRFGLVAQPDIARVIEIIREREIKLLVVDPFAETFEVESENSNDVMKRVAGFYRDIARTADCSVLLIAHTPKAKTGDNAAGDMDAMRGAGAIIGVVRTAYTMFGMTENDAERVGIPDDSRHLYVRLDAAKANMALKTHEPVWWRKEGVNLGNGDEGWPDDVVGVLSHQQFATVAKRREDTQDATMVRVCDEIVRVCRARGWTNEAAAPSLNSLTDALNPVAIGISVRQAQRIILGQMSAAHSHEDALIVVTEAQRGPNTYRKIHVEEREGE